MSPEAQGTAGIAGVRAPSGLVPHLVSGLKHQLQIAEAIGAHEVVPNAMLAQPDPKSANHTIPVSSEQISLALRIDVGPQLGGQHGPVYGRAQHGELAEHATGLSVYHHRLATVPEQMNGGVPREQGDPRASPPDLLKYSRRVIS